MTDSCLLFLRVRTVLYLESLSCLIRGFSHVLIGSLLLDIIPSMTAILLEYVDLSSPIPSKTAIAFPRYFSQQENLGISGEKSNQWTRFWISLALSKLQGSRCLVSSGLVCSSHQGALLSLCCIWGRVEWVKGNLSYCVDLSVVFMLCTSEGKQC